jgi:hypothetical protein
MTIELKRLNSARRLLALKLHLMPVLMETFLNYAWGGHLSDWLFLGFVAVAAVVPFWGYRNAQK